MKKVKNHGQLRLLLFLFLFLTLPSFISMDLQKCNRTPEGVTSDAAPSDSKFRLKIIGDPVGYIPRQEYTIQLAGNRSKRVSYKFIEFLLIVEKSTSNSQDFLNSEFGTSGVFTLIGDNLSKFSEKCANAIMQTSDIQKSEIKAVWTAPPSGSGCVIFRASVVESRDLWYMDSEYLDIEFCEDEQDTVDNKRTIVDPCCACEEAKYELTFERVWSRHTHPKDFPPDSLSTRFSDIIGASHTSDYRFWEYGEFASEGLRQVAEHGSTRELESELKAQSDNIRTIIKARGVTHPNVTGKTFAVFRVDSRHHLISLVSMIDPSPDWIVGVAGMELCNRNCTWLEYKKLNLYPWDVGTDSGITYISPDKPSDPWQRIRRIKTTLTEQGSPFFDDTGADMKPMARLIISRQRLYDKNCNDQNMNDDDSSNNRACETTQWSNWSECNTKCGKGKRTRHRVYLDPLKASLMQCRKNLFVKGVCTGEEAYCDDHINNDYEPESNLLGPECALTDWSQWSSCSARCGNGQQTRSRSYKNKRLHKKCQRGLANPPQLEESIDCSGEYCMGDIQYNAMEIRAQTISGNCRTSDWSQWSTCSSTCGLGYKVRTRSFLKDLYKPTYKLRQSENKNDKECADVVLKEQVVCGQGQKFCNFNTAAMNQVPDYCFLKPDIGHCRLSSNRWFYVPTQNDCILFSFGCGGNKNNFLSREDCLAKCERRFLPEYSRGY